MMTIQRMVLSVNQTEGRSGFLRLPDPFKLRIQRVLAKSDVICQWAVLLMATSVEIGLASDLTMTGLDVLPTSHSLEIPPFQSRVGVTAT
jgi:hypothetical protein